jgi:adenine-specific DNA-methyltransferase
MLKLAVRNTKKIIRQMTKEAGTRLGRFFTKMDTARQMASAFTFPQKKSVSVLDAGAGTGILSGAIIEEICHQGGIGEIYLTCYETDPLYLPMLANNLERIRKKARHDYHVKVRITIYEEDFLTTPHNLDELYDFIIANPPHDLAEEQSPYMSVRPGIFSGANLNLDCLFATLCSEMLTSNGQMVVMLPLSAATSPVLAKFRQDLFFRCPLEKIFLYRREKTKEPLQKYMVLKVVKGDAPETVSILISDDDGTPENTKTMAPRPYDQVVKGTDASLVLLADEDEELVMSFMRALPCTFSTFHLKVHTGLVIDSRHKDQLRDRPVDGAVPLIRPRSVRDGMVMFPLPNTKGQFIVPVLPSLKQPNKNILLILRAPGKSAKRRLMCAPHLAGNMPVKFISTHNKLNYIDAEGSEQMDAPFLYGLHGFLSCELVDRYIRAVSKSTQINARELANIPLPTAAQLRTIGARLMAVRSYKPEYCDKVVKSVFFGRN